MLSAPPSRCQSEHPIHYRAVVMTRHVSASTAGRAYQRMHNQIGFEWLMRANNQLSAARLSASRPGGGGSHAPPMRKLPTPV